MDLHPIDPAAAEADLQPYVGRSVYLHLETTNGAYAEGSYGSSTIGSFGAFIRNASVQFHRATLRGTDPYRVGLQMAQGWIYAEGLTHWEVDPEGRLLFAGHDREGRLTVALQLSLTPFPA